jgi:hypothetical protein
MISAHLFRLAMNDLHSQYVHAKRVMRDPIIIGHSLGGLIIKAALQEPRSLIWFQLAGIDQSLSPTMGEISIQPAIQLKDLVCWHPVSFQGTARLIFIASPLKGISRSVYKQSLEPLILPQVLRYERKDRELFRKLRAALTSIRCDSPGIQLLVHSPMPGGVRWNCIAANVPFSWLTRHAGDQSDPLVTLPSALMEGSDGVLVLSGWRYWHSAIQRHPETIQWIRNIVWRATLTI